MTHLLKKIFALSVISMAAHSSPIYIAAGGGYSTLSGTHDQTGNIAGRLGIGGHFYTSSSVVLGLEVAVQSGMDVRLDASETVVGLYGAPVQATLEPLADILFTIGTHPKKDQPWNVFLKAGAAVRQLQLEDRSSSQDKITRWAPEVQAGIGYKVSKKANIVLYYQGIYAQNDAGVSLDSVGSTTIDHIPTQTSGFLGFEYAL